MNLNEDKRAPLREKDLSTKREMVLQYIVTAAKTVSLSNAHTHITQSKGLRVINAVHSDECTDGDCSLINTVAAVFIFHMERRAVKHDLRSLKAVQSQRTKKMDNI